jgi:hypothetical protein
LPVRGFLYPAAHLSVDDERRRGAGRTRTLGSLGVDVYRDDLGACRAQQADGDLADQAASDDGHALSDAHVRETNRMKRNRCDRSHRSRLERNSVRDLGAEVERYAHHLGVIRVAAAGAGDSIANVEPRDGVPDLENLAGGAVPDRDGLSQLPLHRLMG